MKIVVLAGGISTERDVSLSSGMGAYRALKSLGHQVILLDVFLGMPGEIPADIFALEKDWAAEIGTVGVEHPDLSQVIAMRPDYKTCFFGPNVIALCQEADVVFMALHGAEGENGKIQAYFDLMGIRYTGTDYVSCALAMDKSIAKDLFREHGIPTPAGISLKKGEEDPMTVPFPLVVKCCSGGSSVGTYIVTDPSEYEAAKAGAFSFDDEIIIEQYIKGREFSVGVVDGKALPVIEIAPITGFYDYKNKYQPGSTVETCPADLSAKKTEEMQACAEKVFRVLHLKNYARMDFMMGEDGSIYCLEANTLPGMTPTSLLPQEAAVLGKDYAALCQWLIDLSLRKQE
ncbi:MAG: D-alanine--D-alanine ligase [Lachnospiraceae bacterium]|nr:D-alanine--D-alanine ligase [Lachnospiraceae bacterium]